jgi:integrase
MHALRGYVDPQWHNHQTSAFLLEFVILAGVRISEARLATWDEFRDLEGSRPTWHVPAEHHKIGRITDTSHVLPVTKRMLEILDAMAERYGAGTGKFIFPTPRSGPYSLMRAGRSVIAKIWSAHITAHGFRQTFTNWGNAVGMPTGLIDFQVGHIPRGAVAQAYHTDSQVEARRSWMEKWDAYCSLPPGGADIVTLPLGKQQGSGK